MTLSDLEIGRIQGEARARARKGTVNVRALARKCGRSPGTIEMALNYKEGDRGVYKKRKVSSAIAQRRRKVIQLATKTETKDGRVYPVNCTAGQIAEALGGIHVKRVRRDLKSLGFNARVRRKVPSRDPKVFSARFQFTKFWNRAAQLRNHVRIAFSDEHTCSLNDHGSRTMYVRLHKDPLLPRERRKLKCIARVMIWAACGIGYKSEIILFPQHNVEEDGRKKEKLSYRLNADSYVRKCLSKVAPALSAQRRIFQQDNASPHGRGSENSRAHLYLKKKGIEVLLKWPPHSPDLNMIEYVWPILNKRISALRPTNLEELKRAIKQGWASISQAEIDAQCLYFTKRVQLVARAEGKYP